VVEAGFALWRRALWIFPFTLPLVVTTAVEPVLLPRLGQCGSGLPTLVNELCDPNRGSARVRQASVVAATWAALGQQFLPPYIVIGSFPINKMKLLSFVISLLTSHARRLRSLIGMDCYNDGLGGQDRRCHATSGLVRENPRLMVIPCPGHVP
jgi:hypothetical protein